MDKDDTKLVMDLLISHQDSGELKRCDGIPLRPEQALSQQCEDVLSPFFSGFSDDEANRAAKQRMLASARVSVSSRARRAQFVKALPCRIQEKRDGSRRVEPLLSACLKHAPNLRMMLSTDVKVAYASVGVARRPDVEIAREPAHRRAVASKMNASAQLSLTLEEVTSERLVRGPDEQLTESCRSWARELGLHRLAEKVSVVWHSRLSSTAGNAYYHNARINLNPRLQSISLAEITRTLKHELAHLVANERAGRKTIEPHGPEWRQACRDLGIPNEPRCHDLPLPRRRQAPKYAYQCPRCHHVLLRIRSLRRHAACYECCRRENGGSYASAFAYRLISLNLGLELAEMQAGSKLAD